ncbi:MAG TPA: hypothetical protein VIK91_08420 [Nannocystis sp.]
MVSRTQIRGAPRVGAGALDEGDLTRAVVQSYSTLTLAEAVAAGQDAAAAVLPARRRLWALAERLVPERMAAALRARTEAADSTGRDGVRELRIALADWLDPPPCCRWCRRPIRPGDEGRECTVSTRGTRPRARACRASARRRPAGPVAACGTLALYPAGYVSLDVAAAALACPKGAARSYDIAADRDGHILTAVVADAPPRPVDESVAWADEGLRRLYAAVAALDANGGRGYSTPLHPALRAAREAWRAARGAHAVANGRAILGVQLRYGVPGGGACRADLVQGGAIGNDRAVMDYDASQARYTTYGAHWIRQGIGEARSARDLVGTPEWVHQLRGRLADMLPGVTPADLLRAVEAVCEGATHALAEALVRLVLHAEIRENVSGSRPPRYVRRPLFLDTSDDAVDVRAAEVLRAVIGKRRRPTDSSLSSVQRRKNAEYNTRPYDNEDPERARERVCGWLAKRLCLGSVTGPGLLAALRHTPPVFLQVGAGGDDDEDTQGTDGAGGPVRAAAILASLADEDALDQLEQEHDDRVRWRAALGALARLRTEHDDGAEMAEIIRRHHGLDSVAEDRGGATGESFASIAASPLHSSGRTLTREGVRKIYARGIAAMRGILASPLASSSIRHAVESAVPPQVAGPHAPRGADIRGLSAWHEDAATATR